MIVSTPPARLFPPRVETAFSDGTDPVPVLPPDEAAAIANAVESRQREFALGRVCARRALASLGIATRSIPVAADRSPAWPAGIVGSITHCKGFVGAAVARDSELRALGFDAERADALDPELLRLICTADEIAWIARQRVIAGVDWPKMIFSAKEAVYKCVAPAYGVWLDFLDVTLDIDAAALDFRVRLAASGPLLNSERRSPAADRGADASAGAPLDLAPVHGRIAIEERFVFTAAFIPARAFDET